MANSDVLIAMLLQENILFERKDSLRVRHLASCCFNPVSAALKIRFLFLFFKKASILLESAAKLEEGRDKLCRDERNGREAKTPVIRHGFDLSNHRDPNYLRVRKSIRSIFRYFSQNVGAGII